MFLCQENVSKRFLGRSGEPVNSSLELINVIYQVLIPAPEEQAVKVDHNH